MNPLVMLTGSCSTIGSAVALHLSAKGFRLALVGRSEKRLQILRSNLKGDGHSIWPVDFLCSGQVAHVTSAILARHGSLDGLVHAAHHGTARPIRLIDEDFVIKSMKVGLTSFLEVMKTVSDQSQYKLNFDVVVISSIAAARGFPAMSHYSAVKAALDGSARSLAAELRNREVRINSLQLGWVDSERWKSFVRRSASAELEKILQPREVAEKVEFLLSRDSQHINGETIVFEARSAEKEEWRGDRRV